jgi:hypothetical protein
MDALGMRFPAEPKKNFYSYRTMTWLPARSLDRLSTDRIGPTFSRLYSPVCRWLLRQVPNRLDADNRRIRRWVRRDVFLRVERRIGAGGRHTSAARTNMENRDVACAGIDAGSRAYCGPTVISSVAGIPMRDNRHSLCAEEQSPQRPTAQPRGLLDRPHHVL